MKCGKGCEIAHSSPPPLHHLILGKADEWLYFESGVGAFYYTMFQRTITTLTAIISIASYTSLAFFMSNRDETRSLIQRTAADNLAEDSPAAWFLVFASAFCPWLVLCLLVMLMRRVGKLTAPASTFNATLIWLWPNEEQEVRSYLADKYPSCCLVRVEPGYSTVGALQAALDNIAHHERVLKVLNEEGETPPSWIGHILLCRTTRDWSYHMTKLLEYKAGRDKARAEILAGKPTLLFLTFQSNAAASVVFEGEGQLCGLSQATADRFCPFKCRNTPSFAPLPSEVLWDNIRSKRSYYLGGTFFNLILIFLVVICSTPAGFQ